MYYIVVYFMLLYEKTESKEWWKGSIMWLIYNITSFFNLFLKSSPKNMFTDFTEREGGRERKKKNNVTEKHWCERETSIGCPHYTPSAVGHTCNLGTCPDWESNPQPFGLQDDASTDWPTRPGLISFFLTILSNG